MHWMYREVLRDPIANDLCISRNLRDPGHMNNTGITALWMARFTADFLGISVGSDKGRTYFRSSWQLATDALQ
jgi:hypothetical protein